MFKKGDLVEPTKAVVASYSSYGGRPVMSFEPGMLGVVRHVDVGMGGAQVEFFHPATGCMEKCRTMALKKVPWPQGKGLPTEASDASKEVWFCGSLTWRGAITLLQAVAALRQDYFKALHIATLRIPGIHASRLRQSFDEAPDVSGTLPAHVAETQSALSRLMAA